MRILFQGDSITDVGRNTNNGSTLSMGQGYPLMVAGDLGAAYPGQYEFLNRGISGNRIVDIYARIKCDCWNLEPDVLSLLIGVNDVWHEVGAGRNGVDAARFEKMYRILVEDTLERFPKMKSTGTISARKSPCARRRPSASRTTITSSSSRSSACSTTPARTPPPPTGSPTASIRPPSAIA